LCFSPAGKQRADYGVLLIGGLSINLTQPFGGYFSKPSLWRFRMFYQVISNRVSILYPTGGELKFASTGSFSVVESFTPIVTS